MEDQPCHTQLSFGISNILGSPVSSVCKNGSKSTHSFTKDTIIKSVTKTTRWGPKEEESFQHSHSVVEKLSKVTNAYSQDKDCLNDTPSQSTDRSFNSEQEDSTSQQLMVKCQALVSKNTFPVVHSLTPTQNYFFKSLERLRPTTYGEYRRIGHPYSNRTPPKRKKPRTTFSREQIAELEARFVGQKYLASTERLRLAKHLHLTDAQVKTWFQNRRTKWRRQTAEEREAERNAATKYLLKIQQTAAAAVAAGAGFWPSLALTNNQTSTKNMDA